MIDVKVHIDTKQYTHKPPVSEVRKDLGISERIITTITETNALGLSQLLSQGQTSVLGIHKDARKKNNLVSQQVIALDFDNTVESKSDGTKIKAEGSQYLSIKELLNDNFIQTYAAFAYKTFSYKEDWEKFRVVFILDTPILDTNIVTKYYTYLMEMFPQADVSAKDSSRIFFGGTECIPINFENILSVEILESMCINPLPETQEVTPYKCLDIEFEGIPTWKLIKQGNKKEVAARLSHLGGIKVTDQATAMEMITRLDMREILGIYVMPFNDILAPDANPSCSVWKTEGNVWLYSRQGKSNLNGKVKSYNNVQIITELLSAGGFPATYMTAIAYLSEVIGIDIEQTDNLRNIKLEAEMFKQILLSDELKEAYPNIYEVFGKYKYQTVVNSILDIFLFSIYEDRNSGEIRCLSWMSENNLAKRVGVSPSKIKRLLTLMTTVGTLSKLDNESIPSNLLGQLEQNRTQYKDTNNKWTNRKIEKERRSSVYEVPKLLSNFIPINEKCEVLVDNGFTMRALSREYIIRTFGLEYANTVYPQDKDRGISKKSQTITTDIHKVALEMIEEKGYAIINEVKAEIQKKWKSKGYTDFKYQQGLAELMIMYDLSKHNLTNELKTLYNINHLSPKSRPAILVRNK